MKTTSGNIQNQDILRFAPSPTGPLHSGNLSTALFTWIRAWQLNAQIRLRLDSLDPLRCRPDYERSILNTIKWAGLHFRGTPFVQDPGHSRYREGLNMLREKGSVYPCFCSRKTGLIRTDEGNLVYRGICRNLSKSVAKKRILAGEPHVWRYKTPGDQVNLMDVQAGVISVNSNKWGGDFIVWKRDDTPGYPLASVLDDIEQGITEINRGRDLIPASASQLYLFKEFNSPPPRFLHFPLLLDESHRKLSKRTREATPESHFTHFSHFFSQWCRVFHFTQNTASWQEITETEFSRAISMPDMPWKFPLKSGCS